MLLILKPPRDSRRLRQDSTSPSVGPRRCPCQQKCPPRRSFPFQELRYAHLVTTTKLGKLTSSITRTAHRDRVAHRFVPRVAGLRGILRPVRHRDMDPALQGEGPQQVLHQQNALRHVHRHVRALSSGTSTHLGSVYVPSVC